MRKIIIIGTLHAGLTDEIELKHLLEKYNPDQVFVEIAQEDIDKGKINSYPPEMISIYGWAIEQDIVVNGFDSKINTLRERLTNKDNQAVIEEQKKIMKNFNWKDMNKEKNNGLLHIPSLDLLVDKEKEAKRELEMLAKINSVMVSQGTVLIVTGCGHLNFFEKMLPDAIFPLR